jgi:hypothetical protein
MLTCLTDVIGVTTNECPCILSGLDGPTKEKLKLSKSGLYLDDVPGSVTINELKYIDYCFNMAEMSFRAIASAQKIVDGDIKTALSSQYKPAKNKFMGNVGQLTYVTSLNASKRFQFMRLRPIEISDGVITVNRVRLVTDIAGEFPFYIYRTPAEGNDIELIYTGSFNSPGGNLVASTGPEFPVMPLSMTGTSYDYYFVWDRGETNAKPKDNKIDCNCGNGGIGGAEIYLEVTGGQGDSMNSVAQIPVDKMAHGLVIDVSITCQAGNVICREYDQNDAVSVVLAWMMLFKSNQLLVQSIIDSGEINRYTMMDKEKLYGKRANFISEYNTRLNFLISTMDVTSSDCFICRDNKIIKATILS